MPNELDLDDRIRSLVASAVANAPTAPDVEFVRPVARRRARWPKWTAVLAALLAAGGATVALQPADEGRVETERDTTDTTVTAPAPLPPLIVTAGPDGVVEHIGDEKRTITTEPMAMALALDDGTFVAQRRIGASHGDGPEWQKSDTSVLHIDADGHTTQLFAAVSGFVRLHDFAVVDGRRLLLYSVHNNDPQNPNEQLYALDLDAGERPIDLGSIAGWESSTSRLTLGATGLIIGTSLGVCCSNGNFLALAIPGSAAAAKPLPKATDFGLQDGYEDGCTCPTKFAVDPDGTAIYWLHPVDGENVLTVVRASLDDPRNHHVVAHNGRTDPRNAGTNSIDADDNRFVESFGYRFPDGEVTPPLLHTPGVTGPLEGEVATLGPNG